jgi:hypothetical protein
MDRRHEFIERARIANQAGGAGLQTRQDLALRHTERHNLRIGNLNHKSPNQLDAFRSARLDDNDARATAGDRPGRFHRPGTQHADALAAPEFSSERVTPEPVRANHENIDVSVLDVRKRSRLLAGSNNLKHEDPSIYAADPSDV